MATTRIWPIHSRLDHLVSYVANKEKTVNTGFEDLSNVIKYAGEDYKTEQRFYVSGINCQPETAYGSMINAHKRSDKEIRVLGYHAYQSFAEGEVNAETAHEIGIKLAQELWGDRFQVVVATHQNTNHYHNHFVLCATSYLDGKRFHACTQSYLEMRKASDRLCCEYSLSVLENPARYSRKSHVEWQADKEGKQTRRGFIRDDIDRAIAQSTTPKHFLEAMEVMGYELKMNAKYPAVKPQGATTFFRLYNLGENYTPDAIKTRILKNIQRKLPFYEEERKAKSHQYNGKLKSTKKLTGIRALYFHYCYVLGLLPKKPASNKRMHFLLREDLLKLDNLSAQCKLLCAKKIDTIEQLTSYKFSVETKICELIQNRIALRNELKCLVRSGNEEKQVAVKSEIADISAELKKLRTEVKLCNGISTRSVQIPKTLKQIKMDAIKEIKGESDRQGSHKTKSYSQPQSNYASEFDKKEEVIKR